MSQRVLKYLVILVRTHAYNESQSFFIFITLTDVSDSCTLTRCKLIEKHDNNDINGGLYNDSLRTYNFEPRRIKVILFRLDIQRKFRIKDIFEVNFSKKNNLIRQL